MKHFMYSFAAALLSCTPVFGQVSLEEIVPALQLSTSVLNSDWGRNGRSMFRETTTRGLFLRTGK